MQAETARYRAVIFDMDGVIFDSEPVHIHAWQRTLAALGHERTHESFHRFIGVQDSLVSLSIVAEHGLALTGPELSALKQAQYLELIDGGLAAEPGVAEGMQRLRAMGVAVGLVTSSLAETCEPMLAREGIDALLDVRVTGGDVGHHKPHPEPYLRAAAMLGIAPESCIVIEDSRAGLTSARAAGALLLAIRNPSVPDPETLAHQVFDTTHEALDWIFAEANLQAGSEDDEPDLESLPSAG